MREAISKEAVQKELGPHHEALAPWKSLSEGLGFRRKTLTNVSERTKAVSPNLAFRLARFAGVSIDELLAGKLAPPGTCVHCGRA